MDYKSVESNVKGNFDELLVQVANIDSMSSVWSGDASNTLTDDFNAAVKNIARQEADINSFCSALQMLEEYKFNKQMIEAYKLAYDNLSDKPEYKYLKNDYVLKINMKKTANRDLKKKINDLLASITPASSSFHEITYSVDQNNSYKEYTKL